MGTREELCAKWGQAATSPPASAEWRAVFMSIVAPVRIAAAVREPDERLALLFEALLQDASPRIVRLHTDGISVTDQRRHEEGLFRLAITLEHDALREVFEVLAEDLVEVACGPVSAQSAIAAVTRRLEAWQACLRTRRQRLSREQQIGLLGELAVCRMAMEEIGHLPAVLAWQGPFDGVHDFSRSGIAIEVKTIIGVGSRIRISGLDQLSTGGINLTLARLRFRETPDGPTLADEVAALRSLLDREAPHVRPEFDERLLRAGYLDVRRDDDEVVRAVLQDVRGYEVRDGFPRLTPDMVPQGITEASYALDEQMLGPFLMDGNALRQFLGRMKGTPA